MMNRAIWIAVCVLIGGLMAVGGAQSRVVLQEPSTLAGGAQWYHSPSGNTYRVGRQLINVTFSDISSAATVYGVIPEAGVITGMYCVIEGPVGTWDEVVSIVYPDGGRTPVGSVTLATSGSYSGKTFSSTGLSQSVTAGAAVEVGLSGASATSSAARCSVVIDTN